MNKERRKRAEIAVINTKRERAPFIYKEREEEEEREERESLITINNAKESERTCQITTAKRR